MIDFNNEERRYLFIVSESAIAVIEGDDGFTSITVRLNKRKQIQPR